MAYEFTPMSEVEVSAEPAETSHVLIEEGGVIKRAPMDAVGGSKGLIVELTTDNCSTSGSGLVVTDSYDDIYETISAGGSVVLSLQGSIVDSGLPSTFYFRCVPLSVILDVNDLLGMGTGLSAVISPMGDPVVVKFSNGSYHGAATTSNEVTT